jgi:hypothetical protein
MEDMRGELERLPYSYKELKDGRVFFYRGGRQVSIAAGKEAEKFLKRIKSVEGFEAQLLMARATGQYKHGNEKTAKTT